MTEQQDDPKSPPITRNVDQLESTPSTERGKEVECNKELKRIRSLEESELHVESEMVERIRLHEARVR